MLKNNYRKLKYNIEEYNVNDNDRNPLIAQLESKLKQTKKTIYIYIISFFN